MAIYSSLNRKPFLNSSKFDHLHFEKLRKEKCILFQTDFYLFLRYHKVYDISYFPQRTVQNVNFSNSTMGDKCQPNFFHISIYATLRYND